MTGTKKPCFGVPACCVPTVLFSQVGTLHLLGITKLGTYFLSLFYAWGSAFIFFFIFKANLVLLFSVEVFSIGNFNPVIVVFSVFLIFSQRANLSARKLQSRAVGSLNITCVWLSTQLGCQNWWLGMPWPALFQPISRKSLTQSHFWKSKKRIFWKKFRVFSQGAIFLSVSILLRL